MQSRPLGITIAAIVLTFGGIMQILTGTEALRITSFGLGAAVDAAGISGWASILSGILTIVVAGGLFTLASWAWMLAVVVLAIRIIVDVWAILTHGAGSALGGAAISNAVISAILLWYFQRSSVRSAFGR
jgi:hypothetical protein